MVINHAQWLYMVVWYHCWDRRNPSDCTSPLNPSILFSGIPKMNTQQVFFKCQNFLGETNHETFLTYWLWSLPLTDLATLLVMFSTVLCVRNTGPELIQIHHLEYKMHVCNTQNLRHLKFYFHFFKFSLKCRFSHDISPSFFMYSATLKTDPELWFLPGHPSIHISTFGEKYLKWNLSSNSVLWCGSGVVCGTEL